MRYEFFVGLRYLRARRREVFVSLITVISVLGVMIGVMTLTIVLAVMTGFEEDLRDRILGFNPHVLVSSYSGSVADYERAVERVREVPGVVAATPFIYLQVMASIGNRVAGVVVRAVPPSQAADVVDIRRHLRAGQLADLGRPRPISAPGGGSVELTGIIVGHELARQLGVELGDAVSLASPLGQASPLGIIPKVKRFAVVGIFDSGMYEYDASVVYMSLGDAQRFFGMPDVVTGIEVRTGGIYEARAVAQRIERAMGFPFHTRDWMEINRNLFIAFRLEKVVYFIVVLLIVLVAAFNIVATLVMVVMEKRKDIAVLKSMGATSAGIARIFLYKGLIIGVGGTLLGVIGGLAGCWLLDRYEFVELPKDVFYVSTLPVRISALNVGAVAVASLVICLLATLYPARQAARLAPAEVIRYE